MDKNKMFGFRGVARSNQTSKMELFAKINNGFWPLTIFEKYSISDV